MSEFPRPTMPDELPENVPLFSWPHPNTTLLKETSPMEPTLEPTRAHASESHEAVLYDVLFLGSNTGKLCLKHSMHECLACTPFGYNYDNGISKSGENNTNNTNHFNPRPFPYSIRLLRFFAVILRSSSLSMDVDIRECRTLWNEAPWIFTVAASTIDRDFQSQVVLGDNTVIKVWLIITLVSCQREASLQNFKEVEGLNFESLIKENSGIRIIAHSRLIRFAVLWIKYGQTLREAIDARFALSPSDVTAGIDKAVSFKGWCTYGVLHHVSSIQGFYVSLEFGRIADSIATLDRGDG
nr:CO(2)-response secreted protease-like [Ipomoea batatas]